MYTLDQIKHIGELGGFSRQIIQDHASKKALIDALTAKSNHISKHLEHVPPDDDALRSWYHGKMNLISDLIVQIHQDWYKIPPVT